MHKAPYRLISVHTPNAPTNRESAWGRDFALSAGYRASGFPFFQEVSAGGYVAMAKRYREHAKAAGLLRTLAEKVGLRAPAAQPFYDLIIIGAGPAGTMAAIQLKRYDIPFVLLEKERVGGLLWNANLVENYPGFPAGVSGPKLMLLLNPPTTTQLPAASMATAGLI